MSKKNKNKSKLKAESSVVMDISPTAKKTGEKKPEDEKSEDLKKEFKNLAIVILFILALLAVIYYYDQKDQILDQMTSKINQLF